MEIEGYAALFLVAGLATLAAALLPRLLKNAPVSAPMIFLAAGLIAFIAIPALPDPDPLEYPEPAIRLTEVCVIVSLMGAGLAINRPLSLRGWSSTWRLLAITMPLTMLAAGFIGWAALGLGAASAVLLAAVLAPTDPVLATEVQVGEPVTDADSDDDEVRFALTSEAGLNDGLAFPFTWAAVAMSLAVAGSTAWIGEWFLVDVLWRLTVGMLVGLGIGWGLAKIFFSAVSERLHLAAKSEGFVAVAATFLAYGAAEILHGYGFIAVFFCACALRSGERRHRYHQVLHTFVEQVERLLTVVVIILLGGAVGRGLLEGIGWKEVAFAAAFLLLVRPIAGLIGLARGTTGPRDRMVISFFGVRGVGSLFYVAFGLAAGNFVDGSYLWALVALVVVGSIVIHGIAATPVMHSIDLRRMRKARRKGKSPEETTI
jgi:sodium/hydrogen antiporter